MKTCSRCRESKSETEFWKKCKDLPSLSSRCKSCDRAASKASRLLHLIDRRRHRRDYVRRRRQSGLKPILTQAQKTANTQRLADYYSNHWERYQTKLKVRDAVIRGERVIEDPTSILRITKPILLKYPFCPLCSRETARHQMHGHHYEGYAPEKQLTVLFICEVCHPGVSALEREAILQGLPPIAGLAMFIKAKRISLAKARLVAQEQQAPGYNAVMDIQNKEFRNAD